MSATTPKVWCSCLCRPPYFILKSYPKPQSIYLKITLLYSVFDISLLCPVLFIVQEFNENFLSKIVSTNQNTADAMQCALIAWKWKCLAEDEVDCAGTAFLRKVAQIARNLARKVNWEYAQELKSAATALSIGNKLSEVGFKVGAKLFTKVHLFQLNGISTPPLHKSPFLATTPQQQLVWEMVYLKNQDLISP